MRGAARAGAHSLRFAATAPPDADGIDLDTSEAVNEIAKSGSIANITVTLVAVDHKGNQIDKPGIDFESLSLDTPSA